MLFRYLALVSALASGADWLFIPEDPPYEGWEDRMCARLEAVSNRIPGQCELDLQADHRLMLSFVHLPPEPHKGVKAQHYHCCRRSHRQKWQGNLLNIHKRCKFKIVIFVPLLC